MAGRGSATRQDSGAGRIKKAAQVKAACFYQNAILRVCEIVVRTHGLCIICLLEGITTTEECFKIDGLLFVGLENVGRYRFGRRRTDLLP
jgi:hypothetical protein